MGCQAHAIFLVMRSIIIIFLLLTGMQDLYAVPAYPFKVSVVIDGKITEISLYGDEHSKWAETADGYTLIQNEEDKWCYAELHSDGYLKPTSFLLDAEKEKSQQLTQFLMNTKTHLRPGRVYREEKENVSESRIKSALGERRILVILMEYQDVKLSKTSDDFDRLFNQSDYQDDGAQGSVKDFFMSASYGQLKLTCDVYGPYQASHRAIYYGGNDISGADMNPYALFVEAIEEVSKDTDLSMYDGDGDGYVDNVHIIYAGYGEEAGAAASSIWAHESSFRQPYSVNGMKIDRYSCAPELRGNTGNGISRIGPHCHEIGHALGAMDFYDTNYSTDGAYLGTGKWDVMASGSWNNDGITPADFNPYVKAYNYGWIEPKILPTGAVSIAPSCQSKDNYYILQSSEGGDYYMIENRSSEQWGSGLPGQGLLLFHLHSGLADAKNLINATNPQKCYIVCASSSYKKPSNTAKSYGEINSAGCPYPGTTRNTSFNQSSTPTAFFWEKSECGINLYDIVLRPDGEITLVNASTGTGYTPERWVDLYTESFETAGNYEIVDSRYGEWTLVKNPQDGTGILSRPLAHTGDYSLQLSAKNSMIDAESTIEFACSPEKGGDWVSLKGYVTSYGLLTGASNQLLISYQSASSNWEDYTVESSTNSVWQQFLINIPYAESLKFKIKGIANAGTIVAVDDITISQKISTNIMTIEQKDKAKDIPLILYNIAGNRLPSYQKGINIIRTSNGLYKKVLIK